MTVLSRTKSALPRGRTLPDTAWERRHRWMLVLLWAHVPALVACAIAQGQGAAHALLLHGGALAAPALLAQLAGNRRIRSCLVVIGLLTASALAVHTAHGLTEAHFHFFVMVVVIALYEDWLPFLVAVGYVVVHHGIGGLVEPGSVYSHPDAIAHPLRWAAIHAG